MNKPRQTMKQRIERLTIEANELEARMSKLGDRANAKRRLADKLLQEAEEAAE